MIFTPFFNAINAALGRQQEFDELIKNKDIDRVLSRMESHEAEVQEALKEYSPKTHRINERKDKVILDKKGNYKRTIKRWKLPVDYPKFINEVALVFLYGMPVKWQQASEGTDDAFKAFTDLLDRVHFDAKVRQMKRYAGAETQSAMLFRVFRNEDGQPDCQIRVLARSKGDELYSRFDQYENLVSIAWGYYVQVEEDKTEYRLDIFTPDFTYHCAKKDTGWEVTPEQNLIGKIPIIYCRQKKEWEGVEELIHREEYIASRTADTNDYFSDPQLILNADIIKNMPDKDDENKTWVVKDGAASTAAAASYLTWDSAPASKTAELAWLQNHILSKTFTPNIDFENMKSLSNVTGKALKQMMVLANIKAQKHQETHDELMKRTSNLLKAIIGNVLDVSLKKQCDQLIITHKFQEPFGEDTADTISNIAKAKDAGILSMESGVELSPLTTDPQREIERINEDTERAAASERDVFTQMQRAAEGTSAEEGEEGSAE